MEPIAYQSAPTLDFTDRTPRLIVLGILVLLVALGSGCMAAMLQMVPYLPQQPGRAPLPARQMIVATATYAMVAAVVGTLGVGLLLRRRWAPPLTIIFAAHTMILGVITTAGSLIALPMLLGLMEAQSAGQSPRQLMLISLAIGYSFMALLLIVFPAVVFFLLRHPEVRRTVQLHDGKMRWTDRLPPRLIGLFVTLVVTAVLFATLGSHPELPAGMTVLKGPSVIALAAVLARLAAASAVQIYRLRVSGWWLAMGVTALSAAIFLPATLSIPLDTMYAAVDVPHEQATIMLEHAGTMRLLCAGTFALFTIGFVAYLWRLRPDVVAAAKARTQ